jgi:GNAT superfamily N-acetyltransferase
VRGSWVKIAIVKIEYLREHSRWIPTIARWFYNEWREFHPELDVDGIAERLGDRCNTDIIPLALVAIEQGEIIGTISLKKHDMDTRMQYSPWLASLYVRKDSRNKGIGLKLIEAGIEKAGTLGIKHLYLYTRIRKHVDFYVSRDWQFVETTDYRGGPVTVLLKTLH